MQITIELPESLAQELTMLEPLARSMNGMLRLCNDVIAENKGYDAEVVSRATIAQDDITTLRPLLHSLHELVRAEIWRSHSEKQSKPEPSYATT